METTVDLCRLLILDCGILFNRPDYQHLLSALEVSTLALIPFTGEGLGDELETHHMIKTANWCCWVNTRGSSRGLRCLMSR